MKVSTATKLAFLSRAYATATPEACIEWPFGKTATGYGVLSSKRHLGACQYAHVEACQHRHGQRPEGMQAAHSCNNRGCCNPLHLRWATPRENASDRFFYGTTRRGELATGTKVGPDKVLRIAADVRRGTPRSAIAANHGVSAAIVRHIAYGEAWSWLTGLSSPVARQVAASNREAADSVRGAA